MRGELNELIAAAKRVLGEYRLKGGWGFTAASVAAALRSTSGRIYTGVCMDLSCGIGFCAEHAAVAEMLKHRETDIRMIVALHERGILPPCGRCRELMIQISPKNRDSLVVLSRKRIVALSTLLPDDWLASPNA
jgi:cytidine deaminase